MNHSCAKQRRDNGRWDYTINGRGAGYCVPFAFALIPEDSKFLPPESIKQWLHMAVGTMYACRESNSDVQLYSLPDDFMCDLLQPYVVYE